MKVKVVAILICVCFVFLSCGAKHAFWSAKGKTTDDLITRFGHPLRVDEGADGTTIWIYHETGDKDNWIYIVKDGKVLKQRYTSVK